MPLFYFKCGCGKSRRRILTVEESRAVQSCDCGLEMVRDPRPPSSRVTEVLDNGLMNKRLERLADAERLFADRHEAVERLRAGCDSLS